MSRTVAIHQPNFFPWLGYFNKILQSDVFIFLDDVQVVKTGGSWFNRVKFPNHDFSIGQWITVPIQRVNGVQSIREVEIVDPSAWRDKFLKTVTTKYAQSEFKSETLELIAECISLKTETAEGSLTPNQGSHLSQMNQHSIELICREIGLHSCKFVASSTLNSNLHSTAKLVELAQKVQCETYLCGGGADQYFEEQLFPEVGLQVRYQKFKSPRYPQKSARARQAVNTLNTSEDATFLPGLSIVDLLMNVGIKNAKEFLISI